MTFTINPASTHNILSDNHSKERKKQLILWIDSIAINFDLDRSTLVIASADASFRQYFRIFGKKQNKNYIVMDSPVELEDPEPFVKIQQILLTAGLSVPKIYAYQQQLGFLLLEDFGQQTLLQLIQSQSNYQAEQPIFDNKTRQFYQQAIDDLIRLQLATKTDVLPTYTKQKLIQEMDLFHHWYINKHLGKTLTEPQLQIWHNSQQLIVQQNLASPMVYVHRDFMPRNFMPIMDETTNYHTTKLGILDFQDAVYGPTTYDIACLMKDAFISWDEEAVIDITVRYWQQAKAANLLNHQDWTNDFASFYKAVEWMGLQRHLKVAGIFARLSIRDGKPKYAQDTPRFIQYIRHTCSRYPELFPLLHLVDQLVETPTQSAFSFGRVR